MTAVQDDITTLPGETIYQRIATGDGEVLQKCFDMCRKYGMDEPLNRDDLAHTLAQICFQNGDKAFADLAALHPDKEFILANQPATIAAPSLNDTGRNFNCTGCGGACGQKMLSDAGATAAPATMPAPGNPPAVIDNAITHALILSVYAIIAVGSISLFAVVLFGLMNRK